MKGRFLRFIFTALAAVIGLSLFNASQRPNETELQASYNAWHDTTAKTLARGTLPSGLTLELDMSSAKRSLPGLSPLTDSNTVDHVRRILELIRECEIFNLSQTKSSDPDAINLSVKDSEKTFATSVHLADVEQNIKIKNMIQLFSLFAADAPAQIQPNQS